MIDSATPCGNAHEIKILLASLSDNICDVLQHETSSWLSFGVVDKVRELSLLQIEDEKSKVPISMKRAFLPHHPRKTMSVDLHTNGWTLKMKYAGDIRREINIESTNTITNHGSNLDALL
jgi:hypothetical protein